MAEPLLRAEGLFAGYGRGDIIQDVALDAHQGEIATIIGPNGAGKSTALKTLAGLLHPRAGTIHMDGTRIDGLAASEVARHGVSYVPQEANVFRQLTVLENLEMGAWIDPGRYSERQERVFDLFPVLREKRGTRAGNLSGGQRQMVAFGMALMVAPRVLLLDEPSAGLSPVMVEHMFETVRAVNAAGIAVLMVEQNARQALRLSNRGYVMAAGRVVMTREATELLDSQDVANLYLGGER